MFERAFLFFVKCEMVPTFGGEYVKFVALFAIGRRPAAAAGQFAGLRHSIHQALIGRRSGAH